MRVAALIMRLGWRKPINPLVIGESISIHLAELIRVVVDLEFP
jgi:hypothetical protein